MTKHFCDACGSEIRTSYIKYPDARGSIPYPRYVKLIYPTCASERAIECDLCPSCAKEIMKIIGKIKE